MSEPSRLPGDEQADPWRLKAALAGDHDAWQLIVDEFADTVWGWARRRGATRDEAADVSQNVWLKLKDKGHTIEDPRALPGWLATTTSREALQMISRRPRTGDLEVDVETHGSVHGRGDPGPQDWVEAAELHDRLRSAFARLRERCRFLLALLWEDRWSYQELAEITGMPVGAIGPTRQRCLDDLRRSAGVS